MKQYTGRKKAMVHIEDLRKSYGHSPKVDQMVEAYWQIRRVKSAYVWCAVADAIKADLAKG